MTEQDTYYSEGDYDRADALDQGQYAPDRAWVLTDRDVWHRNPFYVGPRMPHPEDDVEDIEAWREQEAAYEAGQVEARAARLVAPVDDEIPF